MGPEIGPDNVPGRIRCPEVLESAAEIPTVRQARQMLSDPLRKVNSDELRPQTVWTLRSFVEDRWKPEAFPTLKISSSKFYENMINAHLNPAFGDTQRRLIPRGTVQSFLQAEQTPHPSWPEMC